MLTGESDGKGHEGTRHEHGSRRHQRPNPASGLKPNQTDDQAARTWRRLGDGENTGELLVGEPMVTCHRLAMHFGQHGIRAAEGEQRERAKQYHELQQDGAIHGDRTSSRSFHSRGQYQAMPMGVRSTSTSHNGQRRMAMPAKAATARVTAIG